MNHDTAFYLSIGRTLVSMHWQENCWNCISRTICNFWRDHPVSSSQFAASSSVFQWYQFNQLVTRKLRCHEGSLWVSVEVTVGLYNLVFLAKWHFRSGSRWFMFLLYFHLLVSNLIRPTTTTATTSLHINQIIGN